eukprot:Gb_28682 [translate_table: standard]
MEAPLHLQWKGFGVTELWISIIITLCAQTLVFASDEAVAQAPAPIVENNGSLILAAHRTHRPDPFNGFKRYSGGWNFSNEHYWASVGFTGVPLFVIGGVWFAAFGLALLILACCHCCRKGREKGENGKNPRFGYKIALGILIFCTCAAIAGCVLLYFGQDKFHGNISQTMGYVVHQSEVTVGNLRNVTEYLALAKTTGVDQIFIPASDQKKIDDLNKKLTGAANELETKTNDNSQKIQDVLDSVRNSLIVVAGVMLLLAFLGFLFSVLGLRHIVYILVIIGWFLVAGTFILCGIFILLNNAVSDACVAMEEWDAHPYSKTALDRILPCVDVTTANQTLYQSKEVTSQVVTVVNKVLNSIANQNFPPNVGPPFYYNQSGPLVPTLCNPFDSQLKERQCNNRQANLTNAPQVWKNHTCSVSSSGKCTSTGRITPDLYKQLVTAANVSYGLYHYTPFLVNLEDCTFVRETFSTITKDYCPDLRKHIKWVYIGLGLVSAGVMLSLIFWIVYTRARHHRFTSS